MKETVGEQTLEEIQARLQALLNAEQLDQDIDPVQGPDEQEMPETSLESAVEELPTAEAESNEDKAAEAQEYTQARFELLPTPPDSPPSSFLTQIGIQTSQEKDQAIGSGDDLCVLNQAFYAGSMAVPIAKKEGELMSKATRSRCIRGKAKPKCETQKGQTNLIPNRQNYHRRNLPPAPSSHGSLIGHRFEEEFRQAQSDHLESHKQISSWTEISSRDSRIQDSQILDCI
jgi:hypothetical protein